MIDHFQGYKKLAVHVYTVFINYIQVYSLYSTKHYLKVTVQVLLHLHEATPLITVTYLYMLWFSFILGSIFICLCFILVIIHYCIQKQIKENYNQTKDQIESQHMHLLFTLSYANHAFTMNTAKQYTLLALIIGIVTQTNSCSNTWSQGHA